MRTWLFPLAAAAFVTAGHFKGIPALSFIPVDLTLAWAVVVSGCVVVEVLRRGIPGGLISVVVGFALLAPSVFIATTDDYGSQKIVRFFTLTMLATLAPVILIRGSRDIERHLWAWTGMTGIVVASAILNPMQGGGADHSGAASNGVETVTAAGVDTIALGESSAVVIITMVMGLAWRRVPWFIACPLIAPALYTLLQSGSRGPLFSLAAALGAAGVVSRARPRPARFAAISGACLGGIIASFAAAPPASQDRILAFLQGRTEGTDVETRQFLYSIATDSVVQRPFGIGWGNFELIAFGSYHYPHNMVLEVLTEMGVVFGGLFLLWLVMQVLWARSGTIDYAGGTAFALLIFLMAGASVSGGINDDRVAFYALGLTVAARTVARARQVGQSTQPETAHRELAASATSAAVSQRSPASNSDQ